MKRDEAISRLQQHEADLKRLGVEHLYLFGSTARGEAKDDSDVDLFFDYEKGKLGLFELMESSRRSNALMVCWRVYLSKLSKPIGNGSGLSSAGRNYFRGEPASDG